jgi:hypothetical protein
VSTRVIVHPAPENAGDARWEAWIQGHPDGFLLKTMTELNDKLGELEVDDAVYYCGATGCDGDNNQACHLAATKTVLWSAPGAWHAARVCNDHHATVTGDAVRLGYQHTTIGAPVRLPRAYFSAASQEDMAALARAFVGYDVDPEVYDQPVCAVCEARICLPYGSLQWADGHGRIECQDGAGHVLAVPAVMAELAPAEPDSASLSPIGSCIPHSLTYRTGEPAHKLAGVPAFGGNQPGKGEFRVCPPRPPLSRSPTSCDRSAK